jgi:superfamily II DNA or RNA helicase
MEPSSIQMDATRNGVKVRHTQNPSKIGETTGEVRFRRGRDVATIRLANGEVTYIPVDQLETLPQHESRIEAFASGRTGGSKELARQLLLEKVSGELTDVYYSMGSAKAEFFPHQFRPVLKYVESTGRRLLIADEVGLGKTISAIYIWKELLARGDARRLLIICPAALKDKWQYELLNRFGIEAQPSDAGALCSDIDTALRDPLHSFVRIGSLEGLRARQLDEDDEVRTPRQRLMRQLQDHPAGDFSLFDLVIVDEAHAARNAGTANYHFVEAVRDAAASLVMLTATPLQTHPENLFNLLRLVDPDRFASLETFEQARRANIPLIEGLNALLRTPPDPDAFRRHLESASREPLLRHDKLLREFADTVNLDWSETQRIHTARLLESRSLLADVMVRTRKREAFPMRVVRKPWVLRVTLSPQEQQLYQELSNRIRSVARRLNPGTPGEFILIGRQRQLASCIPAALAAWRESGHLDELLWEDLGAELGEADDDIPDVSFDDLVSGHDFDAGDSKYQAFSEALGKHLRDHPAEKIVVFAFFRGTLTYLKRRLDSEGIRSALIYGGMRSQVVDNRDVDGKTAEIERFRAPDGPSVLLSSEVGSEGIDLQFARVVFNYDLPWNPMRVEQRIGRIDRIGQKNDAIIVGHFAIEGTIDDRILNRLYERVNVFKESIGDLEEIFGETVQNIVLDYFRGTLSAEETELRLAQSRLAEEGNRQAAEELEREASALAGHTEFILQSINQSRHGGRYIRPDDLLRYVTDFLHERYPGSQIEYDTDSAELFRINLSAKARDALGAYIGQRRPARRTRLADPGATVIVRFDPNVEGRVRRPPELIDVTHPLVLWTKDELGARRSDIIPAVAIELDRATAGLSKGLYLFASDLWRLEGIRKLVTLRHATLSVESGASLSEDACQRLVQAASEHGHPVDIRMFASEHKRLVAVLADSEARLEEHFLQETDAFDSENAIRLEQARQLVVARAERIIGKLQTTLAQQLSYTDERRRRIVRITEAKLRRAAEDRDKQLARIERQGQVAHSRRPVAGGLISVGGRRSER